MCGDFAVREEILQKGTIWERGQWKEDRWSEKSIQVFLITTAEKTAWKREKKQNERKRIKDRKKKKKKNQSLAEKIFLVLYFSNYHSVVRKWLCTCECLNVCVAFCIIRSAFNDNRASCVCVCVCVHMFRPTCEYICLNVFWM